MNILDLVLGKLIKFDTFDVDFIRSNFVQTWAGKTEKDGKFRLNPLFGLPAALEANGVEGVIKNSLEFGVFLLECDVRVILLHFVYDLIINFVG